MAKKNNAEILKANKGEWSELYVFTKLLADGKLYQSDLNLQKEEENYYQILKAYRNENELKLEYDRGSEIALFRNLETRELIEKFSIDYFAESSNLILQGIRGGTGSSFSIENIIPFLNNVKITSVKAPSDKKTDLRFRIYDHRLAKEADLGFSVKSLLGQDSTLLNTGPGNNFIYNVEDKLDCSIDDFNKETYKPSGRISKITARLHKLLKEDIDIKFDGIQSKQFWRNLKMVDGDLPEILAHALIYRWIDRENSLKGISELLEKRDPLNFYDGEVSTQRLYEYKLKKFLAECAMGMTSETIWGGIYDTTGGVIIAKEDGDIVCFHIYDFNLFREYLLNNTIFEQPSTGEDENFPGHMRTKKGTKKYYYGWLYQGDDNLKFKINLQVRFR